MAEHMNRMQAVKRFIEQDSRPVQTTEFMLFWKACSMEEREEYGLSAAKQLGVELLAIAA